LGKTSVPLARTLHCVFPDEDPRKVRTRKRGEKETAKRKGAAVICLKGTKKKGRGEPIFFLGPTLGGKNPTLLAGVSEKKKGVHCKEKGLPPPLRKKRLG